MFVFMELSMSPIPCGLCFADMCCIVHPSTHSYMGSVHVGFQSPLTSSLGEFLDYRAASGIMGFRPCWRPSPFLLPSITRRGGSTVGDAGDASPPPAMFADLVKQH